MSYSTNSIGLGQGLAAKVLPGQLELLQSFLPVDSWAVVKNGKNGPETFFLAGEGALELARHVGQLVDLRWERHSAVARFGWRSLTADERSAFNAQAEGDKPAFLLKFVLEDIADGSSEFVIMGNFTDRDPMAAAMIAAQQINLCLDSITNMLWLIGSVSSAQSALADARQDARIDSLTKVLNRAGWNDYLRAGDDDPELAIAFIDVDFLKYVNDTQGHLAGDKLLKQTAQVLKTMLRPGDCVARLGGDEFAIALRDFKADDTEPFRLRLKRLLDEQDIHVSFGLAFRSEADSISRTMRLADMRMYDDKRLKKQPAR